ncbi:MAG: phosphoribosylglycinamide formyltransferase [Planctomycetota bacterium]|jgi:formyltetrahydrofolate-dependent phosphoribosylglycinamide formyltransferase
MTDQNKRCLRLGVLISGGGRTLLNILDEIKAGRLAAEVAAVLASRDCKGAERARAAGLDVSLVLYKSYKRNDGTADIAAYSEAIAGCLDAAGVDLVLQAGFLSLWRIPPQYEGKVMNIHPALLPSFGGHGMYGHHVHESVLASGCKVSGCTVHFVTNEYDAGPIIVQRAVPVLEGDDADTLAARVFEQECIAYPEAIRLFGAGRLRIDGRVVHVL